MGVDHHLTQKVEHLQVEEEKKAPSKRSGSARSGSSRSGSARKAKQEAVSGGSASSLKEVFA